MYAPVFIITKSQLDIRADVHSNTACVHQFVSPTVILITLTNWWYIIRHNQSISSSSENPGFGCEQRSLLPWCVEVNIKEVISDQKGAVLMTICGKIRKLWQHEPTCVCLDWQQDQKVADVCHSWYSLLSTAAFLTVCHRHHFTPACTGSYCGMLLLW